MTTPAPHARSTATLLHAPLALAAAQGGGAPEWIQVFPRGPELPAGDGRAWRMDDPAAVIASSRLPLALDYEHAMDKGADAPPASGWIEELDLREGAIWGRVAWTPRGARALAHKEFRYFSPAFDVDESAGPEIAGQVARLVGGALVNRPAFRQLPSLASQRSPEDASMDKAVFAALDLPETATAGEVIATIGKLKDERTRALASATASSTRSKGSATRSATRAGKTPSRSRATGSKTTNTASSNRSSSAWACRSPRSPTSSSMAS